MSWLTLQLTRYHKLAASTYIKQPVRSLGYLPSARAPAWHFRYACNLPFHKGDYRKLILGLIQDRASQSGGMMHIVGMDHVQLAMPSGREGEARAFYDHLLGIPEVAKPPHLAARGGCWFRERKREGPSGGGGKLRSGEEGASSLPCPGLVGPVAPA
jgi:hypothetical protein